MGGIGFHGWVFPCMRGSLVPMLWPSPSTKVSQSCMLAPISFCYAQQGILESSASPHSSVLDSSRYIYIYTYDCMFFVAHSKVSESCTPVTAPRPSGSNPRAKRFVPATSAGRFARRQPALRALDGRGRCLRPRCGEVPRRGAGPCAAARACS